MNLIYLIFLQEIINYQNQCGCYIKYTDPINIDGDLYLIFVHPSSIYLEKIEYYSNIQLIFSTNFDNTNKPKKVELIQNNKKIEITKLNIDSNKINIKLFSKEYKLEKGEYEINILLKDGSSISNSNTLKILSSPSLY